MQDDGGKGSNDACRKRKLSPVNDEDTGEPSYFDRPKKAPSAKSVGKQKEHFKDWPEYFVDLYKIFKALNTVLAFCSSRRHMAVTFHVIRALVEALLKHPLNLDKVAEIKALLPDLIRFAYIPQAELLINAETRRAEKDYPDYMPRNALTEELEEHVLVLEFRDSNGSTKTNTGPGFQFVPSLSPAAVNNKVKRRNEIFRNAVDEVLHISQVPDDAVLLVQSAAREHIPVNPSTSRNLRPLSSSWPPSIPAPEMRAPIATVINEIEESDWYKDQIVHRREFEAKDARKGTLGYPLSDNILRALERSRNITYFYTHQAQALDALESGKHVIVSTSTASGKSVIYQVPIMRRLEEDSSSTALFIYPTKALAQDQRVALEQLLWSCDGLEHIEISNYDGDTSIEARPGIRGSASVIFTNFDMLHMSILPYEEKWRSFFKNLKIVTVDELHYYNSTFGCHVAYIIRRLRRICMAVGNPRVQFVSCSATIANPLAHMKNIFGVKNIEVITEDGAPSGKREFIIWSPPHNMGASSLNEATHLMRVLMKKGVRTIMFCKFRKVCELAMSSLRKGLSAEGRTDILAKVKPYRGGYTQQDRRKIEHEAFTGNIIGLVATNALELGIDIGVLDAVIMLGFPYGLASMRQQSGRAGRRAGDSLVVLVAENLAIDQHYVKNPDDLFDKNVDDLLVDLDNKIILEAHLQCAAHEMPLVDEDESFFGIRFHDCKSSLVRDSQGWYFPNPKFLPSPSKFVSIRGVQENTYTILDVTDVGSGKEPKILEQIEVSRAMFEAYEGAVFLHQGQTYIVQEISHDRMVARLTRADVNWTTKVRDFTDINALQTHRVREIKGASVRAYYGSVEVRTVVFGFFKLRDNKIIDAVDLEMPPFERRTTGFWIDVPIKALSILRSKGINPAAAIHSAEHAFLNRFPMAADVKTECKVAVKEYKAADSSRKRPARLVFFDAAGTQGMIAARAFDHASDLIHDAFEMVESCSCQQGCNLCIHSPYCKEGNEVTSKIGAQIITRGILGLPIVEDALPDAEMPPLPDSIIGAVPVRAIEGVQLELYAESAEEGRHRHDRVEEQH